MKNEAVSGRTGAIALLCFFLGLAMGPAPAAAFDNEIHLIPAPEITRDAQGGYTFVVFGDTRTAQDDSKPEDKAFHRIRNMTHAAVKNDLTAGGASFALYTGDLIWHGSGTSYWQEIRSQFPADSLRSAASPRLFPILGNHENWQVAGEGDAMANFFGTFPYLVKDAAQLHNYAFIIGNSLFVNLCTGGYGDDPSKFDQEDQAWNCKMVESFAKLMESLKLLYGQQTYHGRRLNALYLTYHKPSYSTYSHPPLATANDPVQTLLGLKQDNPALKIFVFNGHNHVTELFQPAPGLLALVAGGGGAPQKAAVPVDDHGKPMKELFWEAVGSSRYRRVNYFRVHVASDDSNMTVEERVLCANDDAAVLDYFRGVGIDNAGKISYKGSRKYDCGVDDYLYLFN